MNARSEPHRLLHLGWVALAAAVALLALHPGNLTAPFFSDDYILLDKMRATPLAASFSAHDLAYGYWRPWSRELYVGVLERAFGPRPVPFHVAALGLAVAALVLYFAFARRLIGTRGAALAGCGVLALAAWELPLYWASAAQDLWMIALALASLQAFALRRTLLACAALALALLSKETAAVVPVIAFMYAMMVERASPAHAARRAGALVAVVIAWLLVHPAFGGAWWWARGASLPHAVYQSPAIALARSALAILNLDVALHPLTGWSRALALAVPGAALLGALVVAAVRRPLESEAPRGGVIAFGIAWAIVAWLPLALPFLIWQPYYVLFGALGAWLALAAVLQGHVRLAIPVIVALALVRVARTETPVDEWGDAVLQREGRSFMERTRTYLLEHHPTLPRGARLYFGGVPRGVVFVTGPGDTPALRVWYDSSMKGSFWQDYPTLTTSSVESKPASDTVRSFAPGDEYFFVYDPVRGWREVVPGPDSVPASISQDPLWRADHERLALTFTNAGAAAAARDEYAKLARADSTRADYAYLAGLSAAAAGDSAGAARWFDRAARLPGADAAMRARSSQHAGR